MKLVSEVLAVTATAMVACASACGTLVYGFHEKIPVVSEPPGASVTVDGKPEGRTPLSVELSRGESHKIRIEMTGYVPYEITTENGASNAPLMDLAPAMVFPPAILLMFGDHKTGASSNIVPDKVDAHLLRTTSTVESATSSAAKRGSPAATQPAASSSPSMKATLAPTGSPIANTAPAPAATATGASPAATATESATATPAGAATPAHDN